ncbi:MAG: GGDEF domain-containing protein, partial [Clostridia bacterium]|nr:GGDEF domain-containing protein [Clostridia bacterium]
DEAYEMLHIQTKQIKDDIHLQLISDRENLATMANFAAKLHNDGEGYGLMFESFKPIGLIENIGILNPDNTFYTKAGVTKLNGSLSFEEEVKKAPYVSGRVKDLTRDNYELIRSAVPIKSGDKVIGILYGVIKLEVINERYNNMAKELDAQLFVYDKETGKLVVDTVHETPGNISFLKDRQFNPGFSYDQMMKNDKGYTSFISAFTGEDLYVHYSLIDDIGWTITLARYENQVFAATHNVSRILTVSLLLIILIIILYLLIIRINEKRINNVTACASDVRKTLLEINRQENNIAEALKTICLFTKADATIFFDTDGEDYNYIRPAFEKNVFFSDDRKYFMSELFGYAADLRNISNESVGVMCIKPNEYLEKTNPDFFNFLNKYNLKEVAFAFVTNNANHITILGAINPKKAKEASLLAENIAVCFSIALYNKKHLSRTELAATTDSLTGALNRVAYKKDIDMFNSDKPLDFSCVYIDVNELHLRNNKYGHAAGDEMLIYIANTLKEVFYGHSIYRMGGDEFLVFVKGSGPEVVKKGIDLLMKRLEPKDYHVAIGMSYRTQNVNTEEMVKEAEIRMYEAKAQYYQSKGHKSTLKADDQNYVHSKTGILEIDTMLSILKEHYNGIYRVSLNTNKARRILMPAYLGYSEQEDNFADLLTKYINDIVHPDFHRAIMSFLNYDAIRRQLLEGTIPKITYKKINGETVILSVYNLNDTKDGADETLWVFAKD